MDNLTPEVLLIAASGIAIVFLVLAILCLMIPVVSRLVRAFTEELAPQVQEQEKKSVVAVEPAEPITPVVETPAVTEPVTYGGNIVLVDVDEKTAACVMAIVSHETGIPLSELIFKKIKAL